MTLSASHCLAISSSAHHTLIPMNCVIVIRKQDGCRGVCVCVLGWGGAVRCGHMAGLSGDSGDPACQGKLLSFQPRGAGGVEQTDSGAFLPPPLVSSSSSCFSSLSPTGAECRLAGQQTCLLSVIKEGKARGGKEKERR